MKFKYGDYVRVLDGSKIACYRGSFNPKMKQYVGQVFKVRDFEPATENVSHAGYYLEGIDQFIWDERGLEKAYPNIVIWSDGKTVYAKDTISGRIEKAICSSEDEFSYSEGEKIAIERLMKPEKEPPKYLNCRFVVIDNMEHITAGRIYEVKDGVFADDTGIIYPLFRKLTSFDDLVKYMGQDEPDGRYSSNPVKIVQIVD